MLDSGFCVAKVRQILQLPQGAVFGQTIFLIISTSQSLGIFTEHKEISKGTLENLPRIMSPCRLIFSLAKALSWTISILFIILFVTHLVDF